MGKNKNNSNPPWEDMGARNRGADEEDEVEQLLRAAQDDVLLKLTANSHIARSSAIDPDLDRRFQALKNPKQSSSSSSSAPTKQTSNVTPTKTTDKVTPPAVSDGDDLLARFAALKAKGSSTNPEIGGSSSVNQQLKPTIVDDEDEDEDDEVEKLIKWAIDAARLDPSPPSDDDDEIESRTEVSEDDDEDSDSDGKSKPPKKESKKDSKKKSKKKKEK